jgi:hypothetical protein
MTTQFKWLHRQPTNEMLANAIRNSEGIYPDFVFASDFKAMWDAAPETEETPLFYRVVLKNTKGVIHVQDCDFPPTADDYDGEVLSVTPLYTHPPKREPLSEEEVLSLALKHTSENHEGFPIFDCYGFASEIEKAHGIGVE